jgi:hypothetical protein
MRSGLLRRKLSQRQKDIPIPVIFFVITMSMLWSAELEEEIAKRENIVKEDYSRSLRTQADHLFEPLLSHTNSRSLSAFGIRLTSDRSNRLKTNQDRESKTMEDCSGSNSCEVWNSVTHLYYGNSLDLVEVMMRRGPPVYVTAMCTGSFLFSCFLLSHNFNSLVKFLPCSVPWSHLVSTVTPSKAFISSPVNFHYSNKKPDKIQRTIKTNVFLCNNKPHDIPVGLVGGSECERESENAQ